MTLLFLPNLPVTDLTATRRFWNLLGFGFSPDFSDHTVACLKVNAHLSVLFLEREFFEAYHDARRHTGDQVVMTFSAATFDEVERLCAAAKVAGAPEVQMPSRTATLRRGLFRDPDGHLWEVLCTEDPAGDGAQPVLRSLDETTDHEAA